ncbi:N-acetylmuramoyl-L-alanine amidase family protein [Candidatus Palauibacter sp.]|uniref:N-acetylmuramoyl-L-alanine amidase family protein n=1 Tax=Candidatus Palauibacter sp. TaxID=3101350 RepID=UPI003B027E99
MKLTVLTAAVVLFAGFEGFGAGSVAAQEQRATDRDAAASERWRRWRDYNRYPGRIPTPEEWEPPAGPIRIGLQAGHWRADEAPNELRRIRYNGTRWRETAEWEANLAIARLAGAELEALGYEVDILPAVVPPGYRAHLFIAIHADGSDSPAASGYRVASPRRDATGRAEDAARVLREAYGAATGLRNLPISTRRMRNYYAFNYRRYEHALHPMTIAVIIETGFMTNARDRDIILGAPERSARGIVEAVKAFPVTPPPAAGAASRQDR